ncbi:MAG: hypothetical protein PF570_05770, partial [Candidatus Cloacimonetes bacterium]|nr:hypothetical protein [Candidatus Cloacimonadota bacterium]
IKLSMIMLISSEDAIIIINYLQAQKFTFVSYSLPFPDYHIKELHILTDISLMRSERLVLFG